MADNVAITAGSGTTIATDDITGVHYQRVKLVNGTLDDATAIPGGANGLQVQGQVAHDAASAGNPVQIAGYASAAAPTDVSADGDLVRTWHLRSGAVAAQVVASGLLVGGSSGDTALNVGGGIAHDGVNSGNPVQVGCEAIAHGTNPTAVAAGDRTKVYANRAGVPFHIGGHPNVLTKTQNITTAVTDDSTISGTIAAGTKVVVTRISFTVDNASTVFPKILVGFGATNTPTTTGVLIAHGGVAAGGGFNIGDGSGILGVGADGEELRVTTVGTIGGNGGYLTVSWYTIES